MTELKNLDMYWKIKHIFVKRQNDIICTSWIIMFCETCRNKNVARLLVSQTWEIPLTTTPDLFLRISSQATLPVCGQGCHLAGNGGLVRIWYIVGTYQKTTKECHNGDLGRAAYVLTAVVFEENFMWHNCIDLHDAHTHIYTHVHTPLMGSGQVMCIEPMSAFWFYFQTGIV